MNIFDVLFPIALLAGLVRGRHHGISIELIRTLKWMAIVIVGAAFAPPVGQEVARYGFFDLPSACLMVYLGLALALFLFFSMLERKLTNRLQRGDAFGHAEYYLGMGAGFLRAACMVLMGLSILNYKTFSPTQVRAMDQYQREEYGSVVFPTLYSFQKAVFEQSVTGSWIKRNLTFLLLEPGIHPPRHSPGKHAA